MSTDAGRWVSVRFPDGRVRFDWVPAEQPQAPVGRGAGRWHVVRGGDRQPARWEWHAAPESAPAPAPPRRVLVPARAVAEPAPERVAESGPMPVVRPPATIEVPHDRVYRPRRPMGPWIWIAAVILAAIGGAGAVAMGADRSDQASFAAEEKPAAPDDTKPTRRALVEAAQGYVDALLDGDVDAVGAFLDPACDTDVKAGYAVAARLAAATAGEGRAEVDQVELKGRRGAITRVELRDGAPDAVRDLLAELTPDGEQAFPWRFSRGAWYLRGACGGT